MSEYDIFRTSGLQYPIHGESDISTRTVQSCENKEFSQMPLWNFGVEDCLPSADITLHCLSSNQRKIDSHDILMTGWVSFC